MSKNFEKFPDNNEKEQEKKEENMGRSPEEEFDDNFSDFRGDLGEDKYQQVKEELIQVLEEEFEENFGFLKDKLEKEDYEKTKNIMVAKIIEENSALSELNKRTEKAISDEREARIDSVTGLERREWLFKNMNKTVKQILGIEGEPSQQEWLKKIEEAQSPEGRENGQDPAVMMADVSYLNLVNKFGHRKGDKLLATAGSSFRELDIQGFRHGGDELTALFEDKEQVPEKVDTINKDFEAQKINELQTEYGLDLKIDIGTADYSEALSVMQKMIQDEEVKRFASQEKHPLEIFNDTWLEIADKRASQKKARERIKVLMDKYENNPEVYDDIIGYLHKGAYEISKEKIEELCQVQREHGETKLNEKIEEFIQNGEKNKMNNLIEQERQAREKGEEEETKKTHLEVKRVQAISEIV